MSIYEPRKQLILTFVLFLMIEFMFTIIGYVFYQKYYAGNCDTILICYFLTLDVTFKANAGIGSFFADEGENEDNVARDQGFDRFMYDNLFIYILIIIMV